MSGVVVVVVGVSVKYLVWADVDAIYQVLKQAGEIRGNSTNSPPTPPTADHPPAPSSARASSHPCSSSTSGKTQPPEVLFDLEAEGSLSPSSFLSKRRNAARQFFYLLPSPSSSLSTFLLVFLDSARRVECSSGVHPTVTREIADKWLVEAAINRGSLWESWTLTKRVYSGACENGGPPGGLWITFESWEETSISVYRGQVSVANGTIRRTSVIYLVKLSFRVYREKTWCFVKWDIFNFLVTFSGEFQVEISFRTFFANYICTYECF